MPISNRKFREDMVRDDLNNDSFFREIHSDRNETGILIAEAMQYFMTMKNRNRFGEVDEYFFRLALDELLENALVHGNRHDRSKIITVKIKPVNGRAEISVTDEGNGYSPSRLCNPREKDNVFKTNGRGIFLVKTIGDIRWNRKGNRTVVRV